MATYQIIYWHDIPAQVRAYDDDGRASAKLPDRFQVAIDQAAMAAGLVGDDAYLEGFRQSEKQERAGSAQDVADTVAGEIAEQYPSIDWRKTAAALRDARDEK